MNSGDLLSAVPAGVLERVPGHALRVGLRHDLHALDDPVHALQAVRWVLHVCAVARIACTHLVLQHRVLALRVLADDDNVDVLLPGRHALVRTHIQHVHEQVQLVAQRHIP